MHATHSLGRGRSPILALAVCLGLSLGCSGKDAEECEHAKGVIKQAIALEDFQLAQQWREYAYKKCDAEAGLQVVDQEIVSAQAAVQQRKMEEERRQAETAQLVQLLQQLIGENRQDVSRFGNPECEGEEPARVEDSERWCTGDRQAGNYTIEARYFEADKEAFLFVIQPPNPVSCKDLGEHSVIKSWQVPATGGRTAQRSHCQVTSGPLAGLHALVSDAHNAKVYVFSPKYLEKDPRMQHRIKG